VLRIVPSPAGVMSALREPASTNLQVQSGNLLAAPWPGGLGATLDPPTVTAIPAPDGIGTLFALTRNAVTAPLHTFLRQIFGAALAVDTYYSISGFAKKNTHRYIGFRAAGAGGGLHATFDFDTGTWVAANGYTVNAKLLPSGIWYLTASRLVTVAETAATGFTSGVCIPDATGNEGPSIASVPAGSSIYLWGIQLEALPFATSYIPTAAAPATRARDEISIPISVAAGASHSLFMDFVMPATLPAGATLLSDNVSVQTLWLPAGNALRVSNGVVGLSTANAYALNARGKAAMAADGVGRSVVLNGGAVASDANTQAAMPALRLGQISAGGDTAAAPLFIHSFGVLRSRLSDAQLQALTAA
jgi:hypothetical protein